MRKRAPTPDECALFEAAFRETRPLTKGKSDAVPPVRKQATKRESGGGLDGNTADRLRRGMIEPETRLDLHGFTQATAHRRLNAFLHAAWARKLRLALVVTGKGAPPDDDAPFDMERHPAGRGVLRASVPRWIAEPGLSQIVAEVRNAHRRHGGSGALYIYLRKNPR